MSNYCQNLKAKLDQVDVALTVFKAGVDTVTREGNFDVMENCRQNIAKAFSELEETWAASFVDYGDGRKIFGPEFEALEAHAKANGFTEIKNTLHFIEIDQDGFTAELTLLNDRKLFHSQNLIYFANLQNLNIHFAKISTSEWLNKLTRLEKLALDTVKFSSPLKIPGGSKVKQIAVNDSEIPNVVADEPNSLETAIFLRCPKVKNLEFLRNSPNLRQVTVDKSSINSLEPLRNAGNLIYLTLYGTNISNLEPVNDANLRYLSVLGSPITDLSKFITGTAVNSIEELMIDVKKLKDCEQLRMFKNLNNLTTHDPIKSLYELPVLDTLDTLHIERTNIGNLDGIERFPNLSRLNVDNSKIQDISQALNAPNLKILNIEGTPAAKNPKQMAIVEELRRRGVQVIV